MIYTIANSSRSILTKHIRHAQQDIRRNNCVIGGVMFSSKWPETVPLRLLLDYKQQVAEGISAGDLVVEEIDQDKQARRTLTYTDLLTLTEPKPNEPQVTQNTPEPAIIRVVPTVEPAGVAGTQVNTVAVSTTEPVVEFEKMTAKALSEYLSGKGIKVKAGTNKDSLVQMARSA